MLQLSLIALILIAILTVQTQRLRHAVIYMGVLSLGSSFVYLLYSAPDVAIAEAVVGSTLATILYLVALQKYKVFYIYFCYPPSEVDLLSDKSKRDHHLVKQLEVFCVKQELEPHIIHTSEHIESVFSKRDYAIVVQELGHQLKIYGHPENYKFEALQHYLKDYLHHSHVEFVQLKDSIDGWEGQ